MLFDSNNNLVEKELTQEELNEQLNLLIESSALMKISGKARNMIKYGQAVFSRRLKKVLAKNKNEVIEDTTKEDKNHNDSDN